MKPFLKKFAQVGGIVALALVLGIGVSVFADNYVGAPAFPQNAPTPLNILGDATGAQSKGDARLILPPTDPYAQMPLGKQNFAGSTLSLWGSTFVGKNLNVAGDANTGNLTVGAEGVIGNARASNFFGKLFVNNNNGSSGGIKIGGSEASQTLASSLRAAIDVDLTGRTGPAGTDVLFMKSAVGAMKSAFITNAGAIQFWSDMGREARLWAGSIKLSDYNPAPGRILASGDAEGNAVWSTFDAGETKVVHVSTVDRDTGNPRINKAYCPTGYVAIGGGGDCEHGDIRISRPITGTPNANDYTWNTPYETRTDTGAGTAAILANGWMINCGNNNSDGDIHVDVMCIKITKPTLTVPTPVGVTAVAAPTSGTTGTPTGPSWKAVTKADGILGQTCTAWLAQAPSMVGIAPNPQPRAWNEDTQTYFNNSCVYANQTTNTCEVFAPSYSSPNHRPAGQCNDVDRYGTDTYRQ